MMLHICCAPDATVPMRELRAEGWEVSGFFYGSNIHPQEEYLRRLAALRTLRDCESVPVVEAPYLPRSWFDRMAGLMEEPEGGLRCTACFALQLEAAALGVEVCGRHGLDWEPRVWRKNDGFLRSLKLSREMGLYRQNYCGCLPSLLGRGARSCPAEAVSP